MSEAEPITPERLRAHAENIAHGDRRIYPVGPLLDAADEIERLLLVVDAARAWRAVGVDEELARHTDHAWRLRRAVDAYEASCSPVRSA